MRGPSERVEIASYSRPGNARLDLIISGKEQEHG